jgi:hypothetical protein
MAGFFRVSLVVLEDSIGYGNKVFVGSYGNYEKFEAMRLQIHETHDPVYSGLSSCHRN